MLGLSFIIQLEFFRKDNDNSITGMLDLMGVVSLLLLVVFFHDYTERKSTYQLLQNLFNNLVCIKKVFHPIYLLKKSAIGWCEG